VHLRRRLRDAVEDVYPTAEHRTLAPQAIVVAKMSRRAGGSRRPPGVRAGVVKGGQDLRSYEWRCGVAEARTVRRRAYRRGALLAGAQSGPGRRRARERYIGEVASRRPRLVTSSPETFAVDVLAVAFLLGLA